MKRKEEEGHSFLKAKSYKLSASSGFGLLELLIALSVFGTIVSFVLFSYGRVSEQLFISNLAHEVALSFREAQSFGVNVRQSVRGPVDAAAFQAAYGLHFDTGAKGTFFVLFADSKETKNDGNEFKYDGLHAANGCTPIANNECLSVFKIGKGNRIERFCGVLPDDTGYGLTGAHEECSTNRISYLDVFFKRPNPDAIIRTDEIEGEKDRYKAARIYLISQKGVKRAVEVWNTGQISIK